MVAAYAKEIMAKPCSRCERMIRWTKDEWDAWIPLDVDTGERHSYDDCYRYTYERGFTDGMARAAKAFASKSQEQVKAEPLELGFLMDLMKLVHPDRQPVERWDEANRVAAKLNVMIERRKRDGTL